MDTLRPGSMVFYRVSGRAKPMLPTTIEALAQQHGVPSSLVPTYAGDRAAVGRALNSTRTKISKEGLLLRSITSTQTLIVQGIVVETKDVANEHLDHQHDPDANVRWNSESNGAHIEGTHPVAQLANQTYQDLRGRIMSDDWTDTINEYLLETCDAQPMRGDGRIYWVPPDKQALLEPLKVYLDAVGIAMFDMPIESTDTANIQNVQEAVAENLLDQLKNLADEVQAFDGTQSSMTYQSRLEVCEKMRARCTLYRETLGSMAEQMQGLLDQLANKTQDMLTLRDHTIVHKDGSIAPKVRPDTW